MKYKYFLLTYLFSIQFSIIATFRIIEFKLHFLFSLNSPARIIMLF